MARYSVCTVLLMVTLVDSQARADKVGEKQACIEAADQGQQLRDEGKHRRAQEAFSRCASSTCPKLVRSDCSQWLAELERDLASVVVSATDDQGRDITQVKVTVDGELLSERLDGQPMPIEPGEHVFRYEAPGFPAIEQRMSIKPGEKNRALSVRFEPDARVRADAEKRRAAAALELTPEPKGSALIPAGTWIFGGAAVAAFASASYFGLRGISQRGDDLGTAGCAPNCSSSEKDSIRTKFLVADISLGVGVASAGLATYFFFRSRGSKPAPSTTVGFAPRQAGGVAVVSGAF